MKISESIKIASEFKSIFGVNLNDYLEPIFKTIGQAMIDICKFDDYLHSVHPYDDDKMSMQGCIIEHYGERGSRLLEKLMEY